MISTTAPFFVAVCFASACPCESREKFILFFEAFEKKYELKVSEQAIAKSKWDDDAENPPISAKKALQLAEKTKNLLAEDRAGFKWKLGGLTLSPSDDTWYWTVVYRARRDDDEFSGFHSIMVVVLMDGTVIAPTEVKDEDAPREVRKPN